MAENGKEKSLKMPPSAPPPSARDAGTVDAAQNVLSGKSKARGLARLLPFLGPAFIASVAYIDPGNYATNIQGGSQFGYTLLWVVVASNLMAMLIQALSAKLGIASGRNLAELCRLHYPRWLVWVLWALMEVAAMATDLAEFLGAAIGFNLLFGIPLWAAGILTAIVTFLILGLERYGFRPLEAVITALVGVIAACYVIELFLAHPPWGRVMTGLRPTFGGKESVLLATGILGATVMPHVIFLHSALTQSRIVTREPERLHRLYKLELIDVTVAMTVAGFVNAAMLVMAAATFHDKGYTKVAEISDAYLTLTPLLGAAAAWVFAISLLASGLSSSSVGTMAGQIIMQGFLERHIPVWVRRLATMAPSLIAIFVTRDPTRLLVLSQVVLSFALPLAIIPLVLFTRNKAIMGVLVNHRVTTFFAALAGLVIICLNIFLLYQTIFGG
ncbi:MAG TPA: Nramp family divalent metal transporter [Planctomycetota bacterium]|jgi:manganese transport protein